MPIATQGHQTCMLVCTLQLAYAARQSRTVVDAERDATAWNLSDSNTLHSSAGGMQGRYTP
eukprot:6204783-Pleurochrysis_carterae.AAC.1